MTFLKQKETHRKYKKTIDVKVAADKFRSQESAEACLQEMLGEFESRYIGYNSAKGRWSWQARL